MILKKLNKLPNILIISLIFLLSISCDKTVENKINGTWERIDFTVVNSPTTENWKFDNGKFYIFLIQNDTKNYDTIEKGDYSVDATLLNSYLYFKKCKKYTILNDQPRIVRLDDIPDVKWTISELTKKVLQLSAKDTLKGKGVYMREFVKK